MDNRLLESLGTLLALLACVYTSCVKSQPSRIPQEASTETQKRCKVGFLNLGGLNRRFPGSAERQLQAFGVETEREFLELNVRLAKRAGADWTRMSLFYVNGKLERNPELLVDLGFEVMVTFSPRPKWLGDKEPMARALAPYLRTHPELRIWQIGNEPDLTGPGMAWDPLDYVDFFIYTSNLIREHRPDGTIVLAGISNQYDSSSDHIAFYRVVLEELKKRSADFDVFDFHFWGAAEEACLVEDALATYRALLAETGFPGKPIWVTELGTYSGCPRGHPPQDEAVQAAFLRETLEILAKSGVERVCLGRLIEHFGFAGREGGFFDHTGLVYDGLGEESERGIPAGTPKEAFGAVREFTGGTTEPDAHLVLGLQSPGLSMGDA